MWELLHFINEQRKQSAAIPCTAKHACGSTGIRKRFTFSRTFFSCVRNLSCKMRVKILDFNYFHLITKNMTANTNITDLEESKCISISVFKIKNIYWTMKKVIALFGICLLSELFDRVEQDVVLKVGFKKAWWRTDVWVSNGHVHSGCMWCVPSWIWCSSERWLSGAQAAAPLWMSGTQVAPPWDS